MSDDLIRRSDAIKATWQEPIYTDPLNVLTEVRDRLEAIPSADRPQGKWVNVKISISGDSSAECSLCGAVVHNNFSNAINFCPNCGADMMKGADDELLRQL